MIVSERVRGPLSVPFLDTTELAAGTRQDAAHVVIVSGVDLQVDENAGVGPGVTTAGMVWYAYY